jgi:hypothetical protein
MVLPEKLDYELRLSALTSLPLLSTAFNGGERYCGRTHASSWTTRSIGKVKSGG